MADVPSEVIIVDPELFDKLPEKAFYLRILRGTAVDQIDLNAKSLQAARTAAYHLGHRPTHWMKVGGKLNQF